LLGRAGWLLLVLRAVPGAPARHPASLQVVGFFVVESSVQRLSEELLGAGQVSLLWEAALGSMKATLDRWACVCVQAGGLGGWQVWKAAGASSLQWVPRNATQQRMAARCAAST
jgi:hypothetical protein